MKNKKLFAILTLVCFMFTLMPVAAFAANEKYAAVEEQDAYVTLGQTGASATIVLTNYDSTTYAAYAYKDGAFSKDFGFQVLSVTNNEAEVTFTKPGTYEIHVVNNVSSAVINAQGVVQGTLSNTQAVTLLEDKSTIIMLEKEVVVSAPAGVTYSVDAVIGGDVYDADTNLTDTVVVPTVDLDADSAFSTADVWVTLTSGGSPVVGQTLKISTNSSAVDVDKTEVKTNGAGMAKFTVSASVKGTFKVYVEFGNMAEEVITVNAGALAPANIKTVKEPAAPVALSSAITAAKVQFAITDANGNSALNKLTAVNGNWKVVVLEKPVGSAVKGSDYNTSYAIDAEGYLTSTTPFDKAGTYTFKLVLDNGSFAVATVDVKPFQKPVDLKLTYKQNAVELDGEAILDSVVYVDVNGVTKDASGEVILSATGYAIENFYSTGTNAGKIEVKANENYVGSKIVVTAVSERYNLVDTVELTVANEAVGVKYANTAAEVGVNNTLVANIVDMDGNKVALNATDATAAVQYIVLEKPADAKVAISTVGAVDPQTGKFNVSFTASKAGEYKIQTIVRYNQSSEVVKYYSGIETITVGDSNAFDNIVVISMGANSMIVNDELVKLDVAPFIENNRTMLQYNVLYVFGIDVDWVKETNSVVAEGNGIKVVMTLGSKVATVNGEKVTLDVAPYAVNGRTVVPVGLITGVFDIDYAFTYNADGTIADILFTK